MILLDLICTGLGFLAACAFCGLGAFIVALCLPGGDGSPINPPHAEYQGRHRL